VVQEIERPHVEAAIVSVKMQAVKIWQAFVVARHESRAIFVQCDVLWWPATMADVPQMPPPLQKDLRWAISRASTPRRQSASYCFKSPVPSRADDRHCYEVIGD
jgi:hypothetical protein